MRKNMLSSLQRQQLSEVTGNVSVAIFSIGALIPLLSQQLSGSTPLQLFVSVLVAIMMEVISLFILKK
jgi:hypothetical protein